MKSLRDHATRQLIKQRLAGLTAEARPLWGKMDAAQMVCHLTDGILMASGDRPIDDRSDLVSRTVGKFMVLYVINIPKDVPTPSGLDQMQDGTRPGEFDADVRRLFDEMDRLSQLPDDHSWGSHPYFGPMSAREWKILGYKHMDHHLRQFGL
ncbi:MAG: DUF1569 domain-containing protein [Acidobacteria bacterium]|nr:DUF1569 domain-containing protein [Acidobacteriota bacterium]MCW5950012.1 DUF1569 domain-containing protein [Pyrinomonadaceae bacterium]